jgi:hypothetical protein
MTIYSITTGVSVGAMVLGIYFAVRIALEYIYNPRTVAPAGLYVGILITGLFMSLFCVYLVKFKYDFDIRSVNTVYSASANCFIITIEMLTAVFFVSDTAAHAIRYLRYGRIELVAGSSTVRSDGADSGGDAIN